MAWTLDDIGPVMYPDDAIRQFRYPQSKWEVKKWISAELRRDRTPAEIAADLRALAETYDEATRGDNLRLEVAYHGLLSFAERVEAGWDPWAEGD